MAMRDPDEGATLALVGRLMAVSRVVRAHPTRILGLAVGAWAVGFALRALADPIIPLGSPYVTFFPAVLICGFLGGLACGVICAVLSGYAAWYFFIPPFWSFKVDSGSAVAILFYVVVVGVNLTLIQLLYRALEATARERERLAHALGRQRTLFAELQHRVANNLAFVSALFGMQRRRMAGNAAAVEAFDDARARLDTMARLHRRLYDPSNAHLAFETVLRELVGDMLVAAGRTDVRLAFDCPPVRLPMQKVMTLSLFVLEAATNSLKHAFSDKRGGLLRISLHMTDAGRARLTVADDGPGWPEGGPTRDGRSLGVRILASFAASAHGELSFSHDGGAATHLDFPLDDAPDGDPAAEA